MNRSKKLKIILWKNWLITRRQYVVTFVEILLPIIIAIAFVMQYLIKNTMTGEGRVSSFTEYEAKQIASPDNATVRVKLLYIPDTDESRELLTYFTNKSHFDLQPVNSVKEMETLARKFRKNFTVCGIEFVGFDEIKLNYRIHLEKVNRFTSNFVPDNLTAKPPPPAEYSTFLMFQHYIALRFFEVKADANVSNVQITTQRFPHPPYTEKDPVEMSVLSIEIACVSYLFIAPMMILNIVREKEFGLKEFMKLMGVPSVIQYTGWFISAFIAMFIISFVWVIVLCVNIVGEPIFSGTSLSLMLFIFVFYNTSTIFFCFFISTWFSAPGRAAGMGLLIWIISFFIPIVLFKTYPSVWLELILSIFPNVAILLCVTIIGSYEILNVKFGWSNFNDYMNPNDKITMLGVFLVTLFSIFLYWLLVWYIDYVFPGRFGIAKKWNFLFKSSFWKKKPPIDNWKKPTSSVKIEKEPPLATTISIRNLTKVFHRKPVVDCVNLTLFEGHITALLGPNGAGKTTTMNILTGMITQTSGTAVINGFDIRFSMDSVRQCLGYCPQENMLMNALTVEEHLKVFAKLKLYTKYERNKNIEETLNQLDLNSQRSTLAKNLSEGMKRKLCLAMALIGNPKIMILDEPTAGMDTAARREVWEVLKKCKEGRSILLSTHEMEEADELADRIAIMVRGKIVCCGSQLFLKKLYGYGYNLTLSKAPNFELGQLMSFIQNYVKSAQVVDESDTQISILLPIESVDKFPDMLDELKLNLGRLKVKEFGLAVTKLDDVFMKASETVEDLSDVSLESLGELFKKDAGISLFFLKVAGLLLKKWYYVRNRWTLFCCQIIIPLLMVLISVLVMETTISTVKPHERSLVMDISKYDFPTIFISYGRAYEFRKIYESLLPKKSRFVNLEHENSLKYLRELSLEDYRSYVTEYIVGVDVYSDSPYKLNGWYNGLYYHTQPLTLNLIHNALARVLFESDEASLTVENVPLPLNDEKKVADDYGMFTFRTFFASVLFCSGFWFLAASFVVLPIQERASDCKHLQLMTGVVGILYWGTACLWDYVIFLLVSIFAILLLLMFNRTGIFSDILGEIFLILILYGMSAIPFSYLISFLTRVSARGFTALLIFLFTIALLPSFIVFLLQNYPHTLDVADGIHQFFNLFSSFSFLIAIINLFQVEYINEVCSKETEDNDRCIWHLPIDYTDWQYPAIGYDLFLLFIMAIVYFALLTLVEYSLFFMIVCRKNEIEPQRIYTDQDVKAETIRVRDIVTLGEKSEDILLVYNLRKVYMPGKLVAVNSLSFGVAGGVCFGLLGMNGAGKTTTFQMLTGMIPINSGQVFIDGLPLKKRRFMCLKNIGYCPQTNGLINYLTGAETLRIFAYLRGVSHSRVKNMVNEYLMKFDLEEETNKTVQLYSGGTKRKLCAALAFIGQPKVVLLDEPTAGVDVIGRKKLKNFIKAAVKNGMCIVITSHSLSDIENVCSKVGVMVNGQFQCLGGVQHLKSKFSKGYTISIKLQMAEPRIMKSDANKMNQFIRSKFPSARSHEKDIEDGNLSYLITDLKTDWSFIFKTMEEAKKNYELEDYYVRQANLEEIFISFAKPT